jgi:hypothetical protein
VGIACARISIAHSQSLYINPSGSHHVGQGYVLQTPGVPNIIIATGALFSPKPI